jgi:hypothetical protein
MQRISNERQREEACYVAQAASGRGKGCISTPLPHTKLGFRLK